MPQTPTPQAPPREAAVPDKAPAKGPAKPGMVGKINDPLLEKVRKGVEESVPADLKDAYLRIVVAGMKVMFSEQTTQMALNALTKAAQQVGPYRALAMGVVSLLGIIYRESKGKMSIPAAFPAGVVLLCYAAEFVERTRNLPLDEQKIADMTKVVTLGTMKLFNITPENLQQGVEYNKQQQRGAGKPAGAPAPAGEGGKPAAPIAGA